jgi:hypothetical protein
MSALSVVVVIAALGIYAIVLSALAAVLSSRETILVVFGTVLGALVIAMIVAGTGALRPLNARGHADEALGNAVGAGAGADEVVRLIRSALACDAAMLFALSSAGRGIHVVSTVGITDFDAERTFLGLPALARSMRETRIVETTSDDDLVADSRSAAFAPIISSAGTPLGVIAVFYRRTMVLTHPDHRRLRTAAIAAEAAIEGLAG